jgi:hypothetical protein
MAVYRHEYVELELIAESFPQFRSFSSKPALALRSPCEGVGGLLASSTHA